MNLRRTTPIPPTIPDIPDNPESKAIKDDSSPQKKIQFYFKITNFNKFLMIQKMIFFYYIYRRAKRTRPRAELHPIRQAPGNFRRIRSRTHVFRMPSILEENQVSYMVKK